MLNNQFLKVKNSLLELEKVFRELKYIVLKNREVKTKKEIEDCFYNRLLCLQIIWIGLKRKK